MKFPASISSPLMDSMLGRRVERTGHVAYNMTESLITDTRGATLAPAAIMLVAAFIAVGTAIDMRVLSNQRAELQRVADDAALSAVRELAITATDEDRIEFIAQAYVAKFATHPETVADPDADLENNELTLTLKAPAKTFFPTPFSQVKSISVIATAQLVGESGNVCMIGLEKTAKEAVSMTHNSQITAEDCAIYVNSTQKNAMYLSQKASVTAEDVFIVGGLKGEVPATIDNLVTDSPSIGDPLAGRPEPEIGPCDHTDLVVTGIQPLLPGTYCGGLTVDGGTALLGAGEYILANGPLTVMNGGVLDGDYVGFFLTGTNAKLKIEADSSVSLSAPKTGLMTGLLFFADPDNPMANDDDDDDGNEEDDDDEGSGTAKIKGGHVIRSDDARRLVGTIYLPDDKLIVDGEQVVADKSEYTVIVARAFQLNNGPNLVIQTDYHLSDIPVPDGVGPMKNYETRLTN